jgi:hypothetical protein
VKSAVAAANNAYESVHKAAKQATEVAEANFQAMTNTAVKRHASRAEGQARRLIPHRGLNFLLTCARERLSCGRFNLGTGPLFGVQTVCQFARCARLSAGSKAVAASRPARMARTRDREVGAGQAGQRRAQHHVGLAQFELVDAAAHDGKGLQQQFDHGSPVALPPRAGWRCPPPAPASAPICRAKRTGTGDTRPPSTYSRPPMVTGWNTAGTALDARTAVPVSPRWNSTPARRCPGRWPRCPAAVAAGRSCGRPCARARSAPALRRGSRRALGNDQSVIAPSSIVSARLPARAPFLAGRVQRRHQAAGRRADHQVGPDAGSSSTWITPMCAKPRAAPPPSARPMRGGSASGGDRPHGSLGLASADSRNRPRRRPDAYAVTAYESADKIVPEMTTTF